MATTNVKYTGDGTTEVWSIPFPYLDRTHVKVFVDGVEAAHTFETEYTVRIPSSTVDGAVVFIERNTPDGAPIVDYVDGSTLTEADLDKIVLQALFVTQEARTSVTGVIAENNLGEWEGGGKRLTNLAPAVDDTDALTKGSVSGILPAAESARDAAQGYASAAETSAEEAQGFAAAAAFYGGWDFANSVNTSGSPSEITVDIGDASCSEIVITLDEVGLSGPATVTLTMFSDGVEVTSGYKGASAIDGNRAAAAKDTAGLPLWADDGTFDLSGAVTLNLDRGVNGRYIVSRMNAVDFNTGATVIATGKVFTPDSVDKVKLSVSGGETFNAGFIRVGWTR